MNAFQGCDKLKRRKDRQGVWMDYILFDLEWNQGKAGSEEEENLIPFEIIEIGAVKMNSRREITGEFSRLVKPQVYGCLHQVTSNLIGLKMEELEKGDTFEKAAGDFLDWCGEDFLFCTWGPLDLTELQRNMRYYGMEPLTDKPLPFYDVQKLFSIAYEDRKTRRSLEYAIDYLGLQKDVPFHRAYSDAYYTAVIFASIREEQVLKNLSYDVFCPPRSKKDEVFTVFDNYAKYISREFDDKSQIAQDREIMSSKCYLCHKNLKKKIRWFTPNGKHYYCVANCDKHGPMKFKIRIRKSMGQKYYAVKTMKYVAPEEADLVFQRREHTKELRKHKRHQKYKTPEE